jgi:hypothetical protein
VDIFVSPAEVFARRKGSGSAWPLIGVTALTGIVYFATQGVLRPVRDAEFQARMTRYLASHPGVSPSDVAAAGSIGDRFGALGTLVTVPLGIFLISWILRVLAKKEGLGSRDALMVATYAWIPRITGLATSALLAMIMSPERIVSGQSASLSVGRFLSPLTTPPVAYALASRLDPFVVWQTVLLAIGFRVITGASTQKAWIVAGILWLAGGLPDIIGAAMR